MNLHFIAHFQDESVKGNLLGSRDSGWVSLPDKPIKSLEYSMPWASLVLRDYEAYLHMVEVFQKIGQSAIIDNVYLMGRKSGFVMSYRVTIFQQNQDSEFKVGDITMRILPFGKEYRGGPTKGWRRGL